MKGYIGNDLIKSLQAEPRPYDVRDNKLNGFILRVHPTGRMVFYCEYARGKKLKIGTTMELKPAQAREIADKTIVKYKSGIDPKADTKNKNPTLREFIDLNTGDYGKYAKTIFNDWEAAVKRIESVFSEYLDEKLENITSAKIDRDWRLARKSKGNKTSTINRDVATIKSVFSRAVEWEVITENHLKGLKILKTDTKPKVRYLTPKEETAFRKALHVRSDKKRQARDSKNKRNKERKYPLFPDLRTVRFVDYFEPMVLLSINTGMRRGELFKLTWENIDLPGKIITVVAGTAKSGHTRHIPLNAEAFKILTEWKKQTGNNSDWAFSDKNGKPLGSIKRPWKNLLDRANIKSFRWHDMRHHFASVLVMSGIDLNTVRELLGHSDLKMTLRYAHLAPEHKAQAVNTLNSWAKQST